MLNRSRVAAFVNFANRVRYVRQLLEQTLQTFQQWLYEQPFHLVQTSGGMTNTMKRLLHGASRSLGQTNRANYHEWRARLNDTPWKLQVPRPHLRFGNLAGLPSVYLYGFRFTTHVYRVRDGPTTPYSTCRAACARMDVAVDASGPRLSPHQHPSAGRRVPRYACRCR